MRNIQNNIHTRFIRTPIVNILSEAVNACRGLNDGIESFPLYEYIYQTTFLKMTGASEQKLKCICWELASNDYKYRYDFLQKNNQAYGEYSSYKAKKSVYNDIKNLIKKYNSNYSDHNLFANVDINKEDVIVYSINQNKKTQETNKNRELSEEEYIKMSVNLRKEYCTKGIPDDILYQYRMLTFVDKIKLQIESIILSSICKHWNEKDFLSFRDNIDLFIQQFVQYHSIFNEKFEKYYNNIVYDHRNRCAHNLTSYQTNIPNLRVLADKGCILNNYLYRFFILIFLDEIFVNLYNDYLDYHIMFA